MNNLFDFCLTHHSVLFWALVYLSLGNILARYSWNLWTRPHNDSTVAFILFPLCFANSSSAKRDTCWAQGMFIKEKENDDQEFTTLIILFISDGKQYYLKVLYYLFMMLFWPVKLGCNLSLIVFLLVVTGLNIVGSYLWYLIKGLWFIVFPRDTTKPEQE